jgi:hypothetical protein
VVAAGILVEAAGHALLDHEAAFEPFLDGRGQRDAAMVGLGRATGDEGVRTLGQRVGHQELQLARLVAAGEQAQHVVALDPDLGALPIGASGGQRGGKARQRLQRRDKRRVAAAGKTREVHGMRACLSFSACRRA